MKHWLEWLQNSRIAAAAARFVGCLNPFLLQKHPEEGFD